MGFPAFRIAWQELTEQEAPCLHQKLMSFASQWRRNILAMKKLERKETLQSTYKMFENNLDNAPTIDAVPVRHGKWEITSAYPHNVYCSNCHKRFAQANWSVWEDGSLPRNYCPHCGARMDGGE